MYLASLGTFTGDRHIDRCYTAASMICTDIDYCIPYIVMYGTYTVIYDTDIVIFHRLIEIRGQTRSAEVHDL